MTHTPKSGQPSSNTPASTWTQCASYMDCFQVGTIVEVNALSGSSTRKLTTVVSPSMLSSPTLHYELFKEARDLWLSEPEF